MAYDIKITGLSNKDELVDQGPKDHRLYKFALSGAPDGFWVLLLQRAGLSTSDVTLSANAEQLELWASANIDVSVKEVLSAAKRAVAQANADANDSDAQFNAAAAENAAFEAAAQETFVAELDELDFDDSLVEDGTDEPSGGL